ncbi:MAG: ribonuclease III, partial [Negativicutes bacterium]|nr:ribonuclease III [Negativicutes bacterium]
AHENGGEHRSNQRLEFLGDAILNMIVAIRLYEEMPDCAEGELTRLRAGLVCERALAGVAREIGLPAVIRLGKGERSASGASVKDSILADACEALVGACYLDGGLSRAEMFVNRWLWQRRYEIWATAADSKSRLQEYLQDRHRGKEILIKYEVIQASGPDHDRWFVVRAGCDQEAGVGVGAGRSKKAAEQAAAAAMLASLAGTDGRQQPAARKKLANGHENRA